MVALPATNGHSKPDTDSLARGYIEALKRGETPNRPDVGKWANLCDTLEIVIGDVNAITKALESFKKNKKFPGLAELLNPPLARSSVSTPHLEVVKDNDELYPPLPQEAALDPLLARGASPLRLDYIEYSKKVSPEGYEYFHDACFWWMLSTIAARRVKIDAEIPIYTPLYIILAGESGEYKKTTTAKVAYKVLYETGLGWLLGPKKSTPQKLIADMAGMIPSNYADLDFDKQEQVKRRLAFSGQRGWMYNEFGNFIKSMMRKDSIMNDFADILLIMDDCDDTYENATKKDGTEIIEKPYLSLLGCLTPTSVKSSAKSGSDLWNDGTWARCVFACPPESNEDDANENDSPFTFKHVPMPLNLTKRLREWHERLGIPDCTPIEVLDKKGEPTGRYTVQRDPLPETVCTISGEAQLAWVRYRKALKVIQKKMRNPDLNSSYVRYPMVALRIAILVASLENNNCIELPQWALAQEVVEIWRAALHELYRQVNSSFTGETYAAKVEDVIVEKLRDRASKGEISMSATRLHDYLKIFATAELDKVLKELVKVGVVKAEKTSHTMKYSLVGLSPVPQEEEQIEDLELEEIAL